MNFTDKKIYTIATAHLDTVWNWDFEHVINVCLRETLEKNFAHFEKHPDYRFNFEGAYRYELFEEYYPEKFEMLKKYVDEGRWNITGSGYENGDVNVPSPESLFRNMLYGNLYFEKTFGKRSNDIFLPDCFGFGWALPSIAEHSGLKGFSTQKLTWGSVYGRPFDIGVWYGPNGKSIFASLDPKSYTTTFKKVRRKRNLLKKLNNNIKEYNLPWTFAYHGVGDVGGAPKDKSVETVCKEIRSNDKSDIKVLSSSPSEFFEDLAKLNAEGNVKLPTWNNELLLTNHGVGSYTSRAFSKRCNRRNEEIADMAERSAVMAMNLSGASYPKEQIDKGWKRTIAHTFHDDLTGTSVERVYQRSWNDYIISANQLTNAYEASAKQIIRKLDTSWAKGQAVVLNNCVEHPRTACADVEISYEGEKFVRAFDKDGNELPCQVNSIDDNKMNVTVCAAIPAMGYKVVDLRSSDSPCEINTGLYVDERKLENSKYTVTINNNGDICSIVDKKLNTDLIRKPIKFELNKYSGSKIFPAWELRYKEIDAEPIEYAANGICTVEENGPARVTVKVQQTAGKSSFTYYVSLSADCPWVSVYNEIEWREFRRALHNGFYFNVKNSFATYDLGLGTIRRPKANKKMYSVPAQKWVDITDADSSKGVSIFSDSKYGWMMQDERSMKLTVVHSPKFYFRNDSVQGMLDFGLNRYGYAIYSHEGAVDSNVQLYARFFNQPVTAFITDSHSGELGSEISFCSISDNNVIVRAVKKAENNDEIIVRFNEGVNEKAQRVEFTLGDGIESAREVNAMEDNIGEAVVSDGKLIFDIDPFDVKSFALKLKANKEADVVEASEVELPYNLKATTSNDNPGESKIPYINVSIPEEIFPETIECGGITFRTSGKKENALICKGQKISVNGKKLYFIGASIKNDRPCTFRVGDRDVTVKVQSINERIARWDLYNLEETADIKTDRFAWECTHSHNAKGDIAAAQLFFFMYEIDISGADTVTLPDDEGLMIIAAAQTDDNSCVKLVTPLYDRVENRKFDFKLSAKERILDRIHKFVEKKTPNKS